MMSKMSPDDLAQMTQMAASMGMGPGGPGAAAGAPPGMPALTPEMAKMVSDGHLYGESCVWEGQGGQAQLQGQPWCTYLHTSSGQDDG